MKSARARPYVVMTALWLLAACGGGGAGSDSGEVAPPPASVRDAPLALTTANATDAAQVALGFGEAMLTLGEAASEWLDAVQTSGQTQVSGQCSTAGSTRTLTLVDRDGNGRPSSGDRLDVALTACYVRTLDDFFSGNLSIELATPASPSVRWIGTITLGVPFAVEAGPDASVVLTGALRFEQVSTRLNHTMRVQSASTPFGVKVTAATATTTTTTQDLVTEIDASKEARRDTARAIASMRFRLASDVLEGALSITTETPFSAWFDTFPDNGTLVVSGAGTSRLRVAAQGAQSQFLDVLLDRAAATSIVAAEAVAGYLWSSTGLVSPNPNFLGYQTQVAPAQPFVVLQAPADGVPLTPSAVLTWQLSRPIAPSTPSSAEFRVQIQTPSQWGVNAIPATATVEGALLTVTPTTQLEPGITYGLSLAMQGGFAVGAADGNGTLSLQNQYTVAQTINVVASANSSLSWLQQPLLYGPNATIIVSATATPAAGLSIASVQWRQISGPAVRINQATALASTVSVAAAAAGSAPGLAVLEVEVRASNGDVDRSQVQFHVVPDGGVTTVFGYRDNGAISNRVLLGPSTPPDGNAYPVTLINGQLLDILIGPRVFIKPPTPLTWGNGLNWNISRMAGVGTTTSEAIQFFDSFNNFPYTCEATSGNVQVLDFGTDGAGRLARIALNYTFNCSTGQILQGWLRMFTPVPPPL